MSILDLITYCGEGGILLFFILMFIEWTPIKLNPIGWIGKRFNKSSLEATEEFRKDMARKVAEINKKLDDHITEDYRYQIISIQDKLIAKEKLTREVYRKALKTCDIYEKYIEDNNLKNDEVNEAMAFIKRSYRKSLETGNFLDLPFTSDEEESA